MVFSYPLNPEKSILDGINIRFLRNKFNAVVGSTGSGKSTIVQLLLKHYAPNSGQILIDGADIAAIDEQ